MMVVCDCVCVITRFKPWGSRGESDSKIGGIKWVLFLLVVARVFI